jgi:hypothetical protein
MEEKEKFTALKSLISIIGGISYLFIGFALLFFIGIFLSSQMSSGIFVESGYSNIQLFLMCIACIFVFIIMKSFAELLKLLIDIEKNTRK